MQFLVCSSYIFLWCYGMNQLFFLKRCNNRRTVVDEWKFWKITTSVNIWISFSDSRLSYRRKSDGSRIVWSNLCSFLLSMCSIVDLICRTVQPDSIHGSLICRASHRWSNHIISAHTKSRGILAMRQSFYSFPSGPLPVNYDHSHAMY